MTGSSIAGGLAGGTPLASAAFKPLPLGTAGAKPPHVDVRSEGAPVNHFQSIQGLPHVIHQQSNIGMPKTAGVMKAPKIGPGIK